MAIRCPSVGSFLLAPGLLIGVSLGTCSLPELPARQRSLVPTLPAPGHRRTVSKETQSLPSNRQRPTVREIPVRILIDGVEPIR